MKNKKLISNIFLVLTFVGAVVVFVLAEFLPINNKTTVQVFNEHRTLFNPAPFTYLIWVVLALLQLAYVLYACGVIKRKCLSANAIIITSAFASLFNVLAAGWVVVWHFELIFVSVLINIVIGVTLFLLSANLQTLKVKGVCTLFTTVPFLAALSWITFLTSINIYVFFVSMELVANIAIWTIINVGITIIIAIITSATFSCLFYLGVMMWSFIGLLVEHLTTLNSAHIDVIYSIIIAMFLLVLTAVFIIYSYTKKKKVLPKKALTVE